MHNTSSDFQIAAIIIVSVLILFVVCYFFGPCIGWVKSRLDKMFESDWEDEVFPDTEATIYPEKFREFDSSREKGIS